MTRIREEEDQFLQVGRLDQPLILLDLAVYLPSAFLSLDFMVLYIFNFFLHSLLYVLMS